MEGLKSMAIPHKVRPLEAAILADQTRGNSWWYECYT